MDMSERKFIEQAPFLNGTDAARQVRRAIKRVGMPGHVWYSQTTDVVRLCAPDYTGEPGEVLVGVYDASVKLFELASDIKEARGERADWPVQRRTRSVTVSETIETTEVTKNIPEFIPREPEPVAVIPASEEIQEVSELSDEIGKLPEPIVAPAPALPAPAKDDAYGAMVWSLVGERDKIDARIAELQLLRFLFDRKASDRMAEMLEDYAEMLEYADPETEPVIKARLDDAREWAKRFALQAVNDRSVFTRAAAHLRRLAIIDGECATNDTTPFGDECRTDAAECIEIARLFEFAAIKPPDPT